MGGITLLDLKRELLDLMAWHEPFNEGSFVSTGRLNHLGEVGQRLQLNIIVSKRDEAL
jgi:hypothetical protein